jgi:hypothetical protein
MIKLDEIEAMARAADDVDPYPAYGVPPAAILSLVDRVRQLEVGLREACGIGARSYDVNRLAELAKLAEGT